MHFLRALLACLLFNFILLSPSLAITQRESNNWAVLICTSKYFFNYRHLSNVLAMYKVIKQLGIPDSRIILMNALDVQCDSRNRYPGHMFDSDQTIPFMRQGHSTDIPDSLCDESTKIDYTGEDVNKHTLMALLTDRHSPSTPISKRLNSDELSNVLIFISGHGGDEFMKFQDYEEISAHDVAHAIHEMHLKKRFNNMLFVVDTCQASTLGSLIATPNVISLSSSKKDENSYAYRSNTHLGLSVIDRFSFKLVDYIEQNRGQLEARSIGDLYRSLHPRFLQSTPVAEVSAGTATLIDMVPLKRFFGGVLSVQHLSIDSLRHDVEDGSCHSSLNSCQNSCQNSCDGNIDLVRRKKRVAWLEKPSESSGDTTM